ncbi:MAG: radical SAM protein [Polyangiaceae bacterium]|nr:radical SAM protein [Polyangiaceae bacterium]
MDHVRTLRASDTEPRPIYAVWELTLKCDQPCQHCGSRAGAARVEELSLEEILRVASELAELGCREVVLIGGEAYLRPDLPQIVRHLAERSVRVIMQTGGRALTVERARALADAGLSQVGVSIDGPAAIHDRLRGNLGSWAAAMRALENAASVGLGVSANSQINRLNMDHLEGMFETFHRAGVRSWQVQLTAPMGRAADHPEWIVEPWMVVPILDRLAAIQERAAELFAEDGGEGRMFDVFCGNNLGYFGPHETLLRSRPHGDEVHWSGCQAGVRSVGIESDGTVKGCPSLPTAPYAGGNVRAASLAHIWAEDPTVRFPRGRANGELWGFCASCHYAEVCGAGCAWTAHTTLGKRGNYPFCYHRAKTLERRGLRERLVHRTRAPHEPYDFGRFELVLEPVP